MLSRSWCWCWWWALAAPACASLLPLDAERLHASVGGYAVMNCHLDFPFGTEIPYHLQWEKDGEVILSWYSGGAGGAAAERVADRWGGRLRRLDGGGGAPGLGRGSLNVTAVRETDAGLYRCRVAFPNRTPPERNNGTFYYLHVDGGDLIVTPPMNVTVLEGSRAELECRPASASAAVQWQRDDTPLQDLPELAARAELPANGSLVLRRALGTDAGHYECHVRAGVDSAAAAAFLDVQYKAKVVYAPEERVLPLGEPASLDCHFSANPPLTNLRWEKDGFLFDPYNVPGVFYSRNGSLLFNQVDLSHEGLYSCTPYNALGTAGASPAVRVRVQRPEAGTASAAGAGAGAAGTRSLHVARLGADISLPCDIAPPVSWTKKDGTALSPERFVAEGVRLDVKGVAESDQGLYVCTGAGGAASEAELRLDTLPPRAPHSLAARRVGSSVHLSWHPGHAGEEMSYQVWYRAAGAGEWRTMKVLSRGITAATLRALPPAAYELRVLAQDALGDGLFSKPLLISTQDSESEETVTAYESTTEMNEVTETYEPGEAYETDGMDEADEGSLAVSVRLLEEGALVTWRRHDDVSGESRVRDGPCAVRWMRDDRLLHTAHTTHDYVLVSDEMEEGASYVVRVTCGAAGGAVGGQAILPVPNHGRLRAAAAGCAAAALLLAALAAAYCAARSRRSPRRPAPPPPPPKRAR